MLPPPGLEWVFVTRYWDPGTRYRVLAVGPCTSHLIGEGVRIPPWGEQESWGPLFSKSKGSIVLSRPSFCWVQGAGFLKVRFTAGLSQTQALGASSPSGLEQRRKDVVWYWRTGSQVA